MKLILLIGALFAMSLDCRAVDTLSTPLYDVGLGSLRNAILSRDGKHLVTLSGKVYIWDVDGERVVKAILPPPNQTFSAIALLPNDSAVVTGTQRGLVSFWSIPDGKWIREFVLPTDTNQIFGLMIFPDGRKMAVATYNSLMEFRMDGSRIAEFKPTRLAVNPMLSEDGSRIAGQNTVVLDAQTGELLSEHSPTASLYDMSSDGTWTISRVSANTKVVKTELSKRTEVTLRYPEAIGKAVFLEGDSLIAASASGGRIFIYSAATGDTVRSFATLAPGSVQALAADGIHLLCGNQELALIDARDGSTYKKFAGHTGIVGQFSVSPDAKRMITVSDGVARIWDIAAGAIVGALKVDSDYVAAAEYVNGGEGIVTITLNVDRNWRAAPLTHSGNVGVTKPVNVALWDARTLQVIRSFGDSAWRPHELAVARDGRIAVGGVNAIKIWDVNTGTSLATLKCDFQPRSLAFSPGGGQIAVVGLNGVKAQGWNLPVGELAWDRSVQNTTGTLSYSPDGKSFVMGYEYAKGAVYSADSGQGLFAITGDFGTSAGFGFPAWSRDGRYIAFSNYGMGFMYDIERKVPERFYRINYSNLSTSISAGPAFSADGTRLFTSIDGKIQVWDNSDFNTVQLAPPAARALSARLKPRSRRSLEIEPGENATGILSVELNTIEGKRLLDFIADPGKKSGLILELPAGFPTGTILYRIQAQGRDGRLIGKGKLLLPG